MFWADDYQFVATTAIGRPSHAWTGGGRFWPLGLCDYSLLLAIPYGTTITVHFIYNCITMFASSLLFLSFLKKSLGRNSNCIAAFCMLLLFSLSSFILIHMACIYPERQMFLMLSIFLFFYWEATKENEKTANYVIAFIAAVYATYLKEPVFGLWIIFALSNLIFGKLSSKNRKFNYALLVNSAIWLSIFIYRTIFRDRTLLEGKKAYGGGIASGLVDALSYFFNCFNQEPILYVLLIIAVIRLAVILRDRSKYDFIADSALFAGISYAFAYVLPKLPGNHYCFPAVLFGLPAFGLVLKNTSLKYPFICAAILTLIYSANQSAAWVNRIIRHRSSDPEMFIQLIEQARHGKRILWITEKGSELEVKKNSREFDQMKFRRYQIFFDYYNGQPFPFERVSDYSQIDQNTIVICADETLSSSCGEEILSQIEKFGLKLSHSNEDMGAKIFEVAH